MNATTVPTAPTITRLRQALLWILIFGNVGLGVELVLLKHTDGVWQWVPLVLCALTVAACGWCAVAPGRLALRTLQGLMVLCIISGGVGVAQHFLGNMVYASESNPSLAGKELYIEAIVGSTPALAPGAMAQLGLIGLVFAFRHPGFGGRKNDNDNPQQRTS